MNKAGKGATCSLACIACLSATGHISAAQVCEAAEVACEDVLEHEQTGALPSVGAFHMQMKPLSYSSDSRCCQTAASAHAAEVHWTATKQALCRLRARARCLLASCAMLHAIECQAMLLNIEPCSYTPSQAFAHSLQCIPGRFNARYERCAARFETACIGPARAAQARPSHPHVHVAVGSVHGLAKSFHE